MNVQSKTQHLCRGSLWKQQKSRMITVMTPINASINKVAVYLKKGSGSKSSQMPARALSHL
jgi:hypothetical protein